VKLTTHLPSSAKVKNGWNYIATRPCVRRVLLSLSTRDNFTTLTSNISASLTIDFDSRELQGFSRRYHSQTLSVTHPGCSSFPERSSGGSGKLTTHRYLVSRFSMHPRPPCICMALCLRTGTSLGFQKLLNLVDVILGCDVAWTCR
jgi:hypothetical protein